MSSISRKLLYISAGVLFLLVLLALVAWAYLDSEAFKHRIEQSASRTLGMEVKVDGPAGIQLVPTPGLRLEDVNVRNGGTEWFNASSLDLRVRIIPLLRGEIVLSGFDLDKPDLELMRDEEGNLNFIPEPRPDDPDDPQPFNIRRFGIRDARVSFTDQISGERIVAENCDWSGEDFEFKPEGSNSSETNMPEFQGNLTCGKVVYSELEVTELQVELSVQERRILINQMTGRLLDGHLNAQMESDLSESTPNHSLEIDLADFRIERFIETFYDEQGAEGSATFTAQLNFSGKVPSEMVASMNGRANLSGTELILYGMDLDEELDQYESTQRFNLVDVAAFFVAGPGGLAITRGYGFASLFVDAGEQTHIGVLFSEWEISDGIAHARDVALSTEENRLALSGALDFANSRFRDMKVAVVDVEGCAIVEQDIYGDFDDPEVDSPNFLVVLTGPLLDAVERGLDLLFDTDCDPFYTGRVEHP